ncbi:hypothetical protein PM082_018525 [Marasmius tenuissimus]|nr:hypothetical protein PM082_018525 [Marasmius tenuissimus]
MVVGFGWGIGNRVAVIWAIWAWCFTTRRDAYWLLSLFYFSFDFCNCGGHVGVGGGSGLVVGLFFLLFFFVSFFYQDWGGRFGERFVGVGQEQGFFWRKEISIVFCTIGPPVSVGFCVEGPRYSCKVSVDAEEVFVINHCYALWEVGWGNFGGSVVCNDGQLLLGFLVIEGCGGGDGGGDRGKDR